MTLYLLTTALLNLAIGIFFIVIGIKQQGKQQYLKDKGIPYIFWVLLSTSGMIYVATIF